jgi:hypothetical protein
VSCWSGRRWNWWTICKRSCVGSPGPDERCPALGLLQCRYCKKVQQRKCGASKCKTKAEAEGQDSTSTRPDHYVGRAVPRSQPPLLQLTCNVGEGEGEEEEKEEEEGEEEEEEEEGIVEEIRGCRRVGAGYQWMVHWEGYDTDDDSWEPTKNVCPKAVAEYKAQHLDYNQV